MFCELMLIFTIVENYSFSFSLSAKVNELKNVSEKNQSKTKRRVLEHSDRKSRN